MKNPKVSICIPAYKQVDYLKRCLDSIKNQTHTDYEAVISDDSPNDDIKNLIAQYSDLPIVYHKNPEALGSPENWNQAMRLASGEYIKIMHHDDWFASSSSLQQYVELLDKHPEAIFGFSACNDIGTLNQTIPHHSANFQLKRLRKEPDILALGNFIGAPSVTIFRNHLNIFFDKQLIWFVDIEFYIRLLRKQPDFAYTSKELVYIGRNENQISNQCKNNKDLKKKEKKYFFSKLDIKYGIFYAKCYKIMRSLRKKVENV
ncbi:hypothetical protein AGMMS49982_12220 [Bacteroidia bacterium]|nr:hypothetical protein AGMMS49982_12220 [Bacteroidia bacterium]